MATTPADPVTVPTPAPAPPPGGPLAAILSRPVLVLMATASLVLFGGLSYRRLPVELLPDIAYPVLTVRTVLPGAAPEEVEELITIPIEEAVEVASDLVRVRSTTRAEVSEVVLEFAWDAPLDRLTLEVREKLDEVTLPREAERPLILRYDPAADPILTVALFREGGAGEAPGTPRALAELRTAAEEIIRRRLEAEPGVAAVRVTGGLERVVRVDLDEGALQRSRIGVAEIATRIGRENLNLPGGLLRDGETTLLVRALNEFRDPQEIADLVVARPDGVAVSVADLGRVTLAEADPVVITRVDGHPSVEIRIFKEADSNLVEVAHDVKATLERTPVGAPADAPRTVADALPAGLALRIVSDRSVFIDRSLDGIEKSALWGGLMAVLVLYLFLWDVRKTVIIGLSIPISLVGTFAAMDAFRLSLNMMSLGGLALGVGMLVDNSIVVLESIARCREEGDAPRPAAFRGTIEVAAAVTASTLTTVAVFLPVVFVEGVAGLVFRDLSLAVVFSLSLSLAVALTFVPILAGAAPSPPSPLPGGEGGGGGSRGMLGEAGRLLVPARPPEIAALGGARGFARLLYPWWAALLVVRLLLEIPARVALALLALAAALLALVVRGAGGAASLLLRPLGWAVRSFLEGVRSAYAASLPRVAARPLGVAAVSALLLGWTVSAAPELGAELVPEVHEGILDIRVRLPIGTPLERTDEVAREVERIVHDEEAAGRVLGWGTVVGQDPEDSSHEGEAGPETFRVTVRLAPGGDVAEREEAFLARVRPDLGRIPDAEVEIARPALFTFRAPVEMVLLGQNLDVLDGLTRDLAQRLRGMEALADVRTTLHPGNPEIRIRYRRDRLEALGLDIRAVAEIVRAKIHGDVPTRFRSEGGRLLDVVCRLEAEDRRDLDDLRNLIVNPGGESPIALGAVSDLDVAVGPAEIRRVGQQRAHLVTAGLAGLDLFRASRAVRDAVSRMDIPAGYAVEPSGQYQEMERSLSSLGLALLLAVFLVYVVMASLFEDLLQPLVILVSIPLATVGVAAALTALALPLSIVSFIGLIVLCGIVVNNAIILLDYANQLRARGHAPLDALARAGSVRLRPILMTTGTTVLGLLPIALGRGEGAEMQVPLAVTVIAGLSSSTLLTLYVVPAVAYFFSRGAPAHGSGS